MHLSGGFKNVKYMHKKIIALIIWIKETNFKFKFMGFEPLC